MNLSKELYRSTCHTQDYLEHTEAFTKRIQGMSLNDLTDSLSPEGLKELMEEFPIGLLDIASQVGLEAVQTALVEGSDCLPEMGVTEIDLKMDDDAAFDRLYRDLRSGVL